MKIVPAIYVGGNKIRGYAVWLRKSLFNPYSALFCQKTTIALCLSVYTKSSFIVGIAQLIDRILIILR